VLRFVIDGSSWALEGVPILDVELAMEALTERLEVATARGEGVALHDSFWESATTPLFSPGSLDPDVRRRLSVQLDRFGYWNDSADEPALEAKLAAEVRLAPSVAYAHARVRDGVAVACLPLQTAGVVGPIEVEVDEQQEFVHFVTTEAEHRAFFRDAIRVENAGDKAFPALASSAFPCIEWADGVWSGLRDFSKPFRDVRATLTQHLATLDDHGATIFRESVPQERADRLRAAGVDASNENGKTRSNAKARQDRTRQWDGSDHVFWWHTKFEPNIDRVHFLYDEGADVIVVGIFKDHCYLPG